MAGKSFGGDVEAFTLRFLDASEDSVRAATISVLTGVVKESPVLEGRFKGNWQMGGLSPAVGVLDNTDKSGNSTIAKGKAKILSQKDWSEFNITNNMPYSIPIEYGLYGEGPNTSGGYSTQAIGGVVRPTIARANKNLEDEFNKRKPK